MISIVSLIYRSRVYADAVWESIHENTPEIAAGEAEFFFVANDPTPELVEHLEHKNYRHVVQINKHYTEDELQLRGIGKPEYIHRVYRGWNRAIREARAWVCLVNSDNMFSPGWLTKLIPYMGEKMFVSSQLIERHHPRHGVFPGAIHGEFGAHPSTFDKDGFLKAVALETPYSIVTTGGAFMPSLFNREFAHEVGLYPEGNLCDSAGNITAYGDQDFVRRILACGGTHITVQNSIVYHFKEGEMEE